MTVRDSMILGVLTILISAFMFCYFSGFNPTFMMWVVIVTIAVLALFFFMAYKRGLFSNPNKK